MKFRISKKEILRRKYVPIMTIIPFIIYAILTIFIPKKDEVNLTELLWILVIISIFTVGITTYMSYNFIKFAKTHKLEINSKGLTFFDNNVETLCPWKDITKVNVNSKKSKIKRLSFETNSSDLIISLSIYEDLEILNNELKKYLNHNLWEIKT